MFNQQILKGLSGFHSYSEEILSWIGFNGLLKLKLLIPGTLTQDTDSLRSDFLIVNRLHSEHTYTEDAKLQHV